MTGISLSYDLKYTMILNNFQVDKIDGAPVSRRLKGTVGSNYTIKFDCCKFDMELFMCSFCIIYQEKEIKKEIVDHMMEIIKILDKEFVRNFKDLRVDIMSLDIKIYFYLPDRPSDLEKNANQKLVRVTRLGRMLDQPYYECGYNLDYTEGLILKKLKLKTTDITPNSTSLLGW